MYVHVDKYWIQFNDDSITILLTFQKTANTVSRQVSCGHGVVYAEIANTRTFNLLSDERLCGPIVRIRQTDGQGRHEGLLSDTAVSD